MSPSALSAVLNSIPTLPLVREQETRKKRDAFRFLAGTLLLIRDCHLSEECVLRPYAVEAPDTPTTNTNVPRARLTVCPAAERDALARAEARTELILHEAVQTTG